QLRPIEFGLDIVGRCIASTTSSHFHDVRFLEGDVLNKLTGFSSLLAEAVGFSSGIQKEGSCFDRPSDIKTSPYLFLRFRVKTSLGLAFLNTSR
ncbi:hypothetical protein PENTCL1PPCAC_27327, partial [Pristionchus entomophagus]